MLSSLIPNQTICFLSFIIQGDQNRGAELDCCWTLLVINLKEQFDGFVQNKSIFISYHITLFFYLFLFCPEYLPDPSKAQEHLKKLSEVLNEDMRIRSFMNHVVDPAVTCKKAIQAVVSYTLLSLTN